ncbi:hypothetical protein JM946_09335 [Steroidobacter sp. S1-65]|uniref:DUF2946 domain-containing protein n=1 Tax=Steroidobacter gossypii TaxID=2805490 RepID=A0ABS1WVF4_9GAMM|nr:hypothetical protein [Steroidobacter gossypii]
MDFFVRPGRRGQYHNVCAAEGFAVLRRLFPVNDALIHSNDLDGPLSSARHFGAMTRSGHLFRTSDRARRYNVVALAVVLCAWLVAAAMHLHANDPDAGNADSAHCAHCSALSGSAAPAPELRVPPNIVVAAMVVAFDDAIVAGRAAPSFYLSRGPPAA